MLQLRHFLHLPELDPLIEQIVHEGPGLIAVAGLGLRPHMPATREGFLPSGHANILRILMNEMLAAGPHVQALVVTGESGAVRVSRQYERRVQVWGVRPPETYAARIAAAMRQWPNLLVVDGLTAETIQPALDAARQGYRVLSQIDTVFSGAGVLRHLRNLGASAQQLDGVSWVVTVQRMEMLCPNCKQPMLPDSERLDQLCRRYPNREGSILEATFWGALGCADCQNTGRKGNLMAFDVYRPRQDGAGQSVLPLDEYVLGLAMRGYLALDDVAELGTDRLYHMFTLLTAEEHALSEVNAALQRKVVELEAANRVLQQRTEALISLQDIGQALTSTAGLRDLAARVCRHAGELCGAERVVLYYKSHAGQTRVLAVHGWNPAYVDQLLDATRVFEAADVRRSEPTAYGRLPPGLAADTAGPALSAGLRVPLIAQDELVGLMILQSTQKTRFAPGEVALLKTFANQAALSIQRAGLIDQLYDKIRQLEAAQVELAHKERLERELELARQVQQSVLPRTFPQLPGYTFAARSYPAREVGGDFYDVFVLDEDHLGLVVADVSDKGMPAALYMALTRSLLLAEARRELEPQQVLQSVNRLLLELGQPNMFVTMFYGVLDLSTRQMTYIRAGHDRPLLLRDGIVHPLSGDGTSLGILEQPVFQLAEERIILAPQDLLVLYTDGLTDVPGADGQLYGREQLETLLLSHAALHPDQLLAAVFDHLTAYRGDAPQYDDMTLLVVGVS